MVNSVAIQSSGQLLRGFLDAAKGGGSVELKGAEVQQTPAKRGFFARVVQWFRGETPAKTNAQTRASFHEALNKAFGREIAKDALASYRLQGNNSDKPLMSRDVRDILRRATADSNMEKLGLKFKESNQSILNLGAKLETLQEKNAALVASKSLDVNGKEMAAKQLRDELEQADAGVSGLEIRQAGKSSAHLELAAALRKELDSIDADDASWIDVSEPKK